MGDACQQRNLPRGVFPSKLQQAPSQCGFLDGNQCSSRELGTIHHAWCYVTVAPARAGRRFSFRKIRIYWGKGGGGGGGRTNTPMANFIGEIEVAM